MINRGEQGKGYSRADQAHRACNQFKQLPISEGFPLEQLSRGRMDGSPPLGEDTHPVRWGREQDLDISLSFTSSLWWLQGKIQVRSLYLLNITLQKAKQDFVVIPSPAGLWRRWVPASFSSSVIGSTWISFLAMLWSLIVLEMPNF